MEKMRICILSSFDAWKRSAQFEAARRSLQTAPTSLNVEGLIQSSALRPLSKKSDNAIAMASQ